MSDKPRAVIYYGGFVHRAGGAFMHVRMLAPELERVGYSVEVVTLDNLPALLRYLPHVVEKVLNACSPPSGYLYKGSLARLLFRLFASKCDLRVFEDVYLAWNSEVPSVSLLHALWSDNLQGWDLPDRAVGGLVRREAAVLRGIRHPIITVSTQYHDYLVQEHMRGEPVPPIHVIPLGIDLSRFSVPRRRTQAGRSLIYVGALEARKNVQLLLYIFESLWAKDSSYKLTIVGNGPEGPALEEYCSVRALPIKFLGRLDHARVIEELSRHDVLVHTSTKESFSFALLEAKLCGLKTCAYGGLQVPTEFIDARVESFEIEDWCAAIRSLDNVDADFQPHTYSSRTMTLATLELLGIRPRAGQVSTPIRTG